MNGDDLVADGIPDPVAEDVGLAGDLDRLEAKTVIPVRTRLAEE